MVSREDSDLDTLVRQVTDGFSIFCEEYKALALQHWRVDARLALAEQQFEIVKRLLPEEVAADNASAIRKPANQASIAPRKSLDDWLDDAARKEVSKHEAISKIKEAEFASFKLQTRLKSGQNLRLAQLPTAASIQATRTARRSRMKFGGSGSQTPDIEEQDFTTPGNPGELNCPYATSGAKDGNSKGHGCLVNKPTDPPTPRSSASRVVSQTKRSLGGSQTGSRRASFVDPLRPDPQTLKAPTAPPSEAMSAGPGCPIRFMDQHSPEDIAKYFEQHKHELPRSHEICVKRFQDNADSIKQLDQKYGSLVTMIQGLGAKHQPMLPDVPTSEGHALQSEDKSIQRVKEWAEEVDNSQGPNSQAVEAGGEQLDKEFEPKAAEDLEAVEVRQGRFDRPLKEIRVGESPSRPWGVPIPAKYLDRAASDTCSEAAKVSSRHVPDVKPAPQTAPVPLLVANKVSERPSKEEVDGKMRLKGKCPFDHTAMTANTTNPHMSPVEKEDKDTALAKEKEERKDNDDRAEDVTSSSEDKQLEGGETWASNIVNHGLAIVSDSSQLTGCNLTNHGTLLFGFNGEASRRLAAQFQSP